MKYSALVVVAAAITGLLFLLGIEFHWPRALFHCESFGCSAMGAAYLIYAAIIVTAFVLAGAGFGPKPRASSALFAGAVATIALMVVFGLLMVRQQMRVAGDMRAHEAACTKYPQLCPERLSPVSPKAPEGGTAPAGHA